MEKQKINLFKINNSKQKNSFVFSLPHPDDNLTYDYFLLTDGEEIVIQRITNVLNFIQTDSIELIPIPYETEEFSIFQELYKKYLSNYKQLERKLEFN